MANLRDMKKRITSVKSTKQITRHHGNGGYGKDPQGV